MSFPDSMPQAPLRKTSKGQSPHGPGWFALHTSEAPWVNTERFGAFAKFEGDTRFEQLGVNIHVLQPGQPGCLYHREAYQEDFFVLSGECTAIIEGAEHPLRAGHFVHCPPGTNHVFVGAGDGPCAILMIGARGADPGLYYPVDEVAAKHGASAEAPTPDPSVAYGKRPATQPDFDPIWPLE